MTWHRIMAQLPARRQTLLFSATMPPEVARLGQTVLRDPQTVTIGRQGTPVAAVAQTAYPVPKHRKAALLQHLLEQWETPSVLVFARTRHGAKKLAGTLYDAGASATELAQPAAMAKLVASETATYCADAAVQILGADGLTKQYGHCEQIYRDARALPIVGGSSEMARYLIASGDLPGLKLDL